MKGINLNPILPVRVEPHEQSEQCTQLLFGEMFTYEVINEKWCFIVNENDGYEGFVSKNMITILTESEINSLATATRTIVSSPIAHLQRNGESLILPMGSTLYNVKNNVFAIKGDSYQVNAKDVAAEKSPVTVTKKLLNVPYLWGGKSVMGIDCSGLVQTVFNVCGTQLDRDASQQVNEGEVVCFLTEAQSGDLAFFENEEGSIVHVGILIDNKHIIHASGSVKISAIDDYGIVGENGYTHKLRVIKRL